MGVNVGRREIYQLLLRIGVGLDEMDSHSGCEHALTESVGAKDVQRTAR